MGLLHIMARGGDDYRDYKEAVKMAKKAIDTICDLTEEMEEKFSSRDHSRWEDIEERRGMGRYR